MKIGVICPSEIAMRRFMPAIQTINNMEFVGVGICSKDEFFGAQKLDSISFARALEAERKKAESFVDEYGGHIFDSYTRIIHSEEIEALYIPLPPALHYKWAKLALECGKHVLIEKPSTLSTAESEDLVRIARGKNLALHENYMFAFHSQLDAIDNIVNSKELGDVRSYRINFGFPLRSKNDFRYNMELGGGALNDAGGYTIKYANRLLGETMTIKYAQLNYIDGFLVDMYGTGICVNDRGDIAHISFGMDNDYKCELEIWGSKGTLLSKRVLTAPVGFMPELILYKNNAEERIKLPADDTFRKSIQYFYNCIINDQNKKNAYEEIVRQATKVDDFRKIAKRFCK